MLGEYNKYDMPKKENIFLTQALNVLYKENWTVMANMETTITRKIIDHLLKKDSLFLIVEFNKVFINFFVTRY